MALLIGKGAMAQTALPSLSEPAISPDGKEIAFASGGDIWTVPAAGGEAHLLVTHPGRVRAVMGKLKDDPTAETLAGVAELWRVVLDEMAADDGVANVEEALACFLARELSDVRDRDAAERTCLFSLAPWGITRPTVGYAPEQRVERIIRHEPVKMLLAARRLTDGLRDMISRGGSTEALRTAVRKSGIRGLREAGLEAIFNGVTTIEEVVRETVLEDDL